MSLATITKGQFGNFRYKVEYKSSYVQMDVYKDGVYLSCFGSDEREKGHGTEVLNLCRRIARKLRKPLRLTAAPYHLNGVKPYDIERLKSYYQKRGFSIVTDGGSVCSMEYNPCKANHHAC
ncbi:hypothetical protein F67_I3_11_006 [Rhizobium phage RHph_I3_11]|nr:hypothetical protein F67_I3_11_006 [Rhizobium phage RHph_I3_11]